MKKRIIAILAGSLLLAVMAAGCNKQEGQDKQQDETKTQTTGAEAEIDAMSFEELKEAAKGTTVSFYGWGGDEKLNAWLDDVFAPYMKENYDITMDRVPMDIDQVLSKLSGELQAGKDSGDIDMVWINGENFRSARENDMLYGPFLEKLPNAETYIDMGSEDVKYDFAYPIEGYEAPYGKAQLVMVNDTAVTPEQPSSAEELLEFAKKNQGKVTYPALPDFTGSAFVRNIIYEICGYEVFMDMEADKETIKTAIEPALEYLRELNPYLWNEGKSFPAESTQVDNMFMDGEIVMTMGYDAFGVAAMIENGSYPETASSFIFEKGTVGNTNFMTIAKNSGNKAGALIAINEMMSAQMQLSRYEVLRTLPVVSYDKLSAAEKEAFDKVDTGKGTLPQDELLEKRLPEMPAELVPIIEEIWEEEVVGK